jgi:hypothetical protein
MATKTKIALSTAILLSTAFTASAATKHHRVTYVRSAIYNVVPDYSAARGLWPSSGPPLRTTPDGW